MLEEDAQRSDRDLEDGKVPILEDSGTGNRFLLYATERGTEVELLYKGDTFWASQEQMADMFGVDRTSISRHLTNIYDEAELERSATCAEIAQVRMEGAREVRRPRLVYNLNAIISVGYRVTSKQGTLFRIWATDKLFQILTKGFYIDQRKFKGQPDRLAELRRIIQDIRADEANIYAELRRILSMCQDYALLDPKAANLYFATFQNRMLYAITENTAAEIIIKRADCTKPNMGLKTWGSGDQPLQGDALTAKNYLGELEIRDLNRLVDMVLNFFEDQTERGWLVTLKDADEKLAEILTVNKRELLPNGPRATKPAGEAHAKEQYKLFDKARREERKRVALQQINEQARIIRAARPKRLKSESQPKIDKKKD
jgi:hypothetical protein